MSVQQQKFKEIADAIRKKTGSKDLIKPSEFAGKVAEVYEAGKKAQNNEWWDTYLAPMRNGRPTNNLFSGPSWNGNTFYPTQDIIPLENASSLFDRFSWNASVARIDLAQRLEDCGVRLDITNAKAVAYLFNYAWTTRVPALNCNTTAYSGLTSVFSNAQYLVTIDELIIRNDGVNTFSNTFTGCKALKNVKFTGVIGRSISFSDCPLTVESMRNVISCLNDFAGTDNEYKYTLTLKSDCWATLDAEGATAPGGKMWRDYAEAKGWNTV